MYSNRWHKRLNESIPDFSSSGFGTSMLVENSLEVFCSSFEPIDDGYCYPELPVLQSGAATATSDGHLCMEPVAAGWYNPVAMKQPPDGLNRVAVAEQRGLIWMLSLSNVSQRSLYMNTSSLMTPLIGRGDERGLHDLVFHPDYATNGLFYVLYYNNQDVPGCDVVEFASDSQLSRGEIQQGRLIFSVCCMHTAGMWRHLMAM
jgi:glucose/arabinose dehydrogenase